MYYQYESFSDEYVFQEFLKDIFNKKYATGSFEEYRSRGQAQFGVDVYSAGQQVAVQAKKKDLMRTEKVIKKELLADLLETVEQVKNFPHPVEQIYFATNTKKYAELQDEAIRLSQKHKKIILFYSWEDLQKDISIYPEIRKKYYPHLNPSLFNRELVAIAKLPLNKMLGREADLQKIGALLSSHQSLLIKSIGGAGKSTVAKMFYQKQGNQFDHLLWLDSVQNFKHNIGNHQGLLTGLHCEFETTDTAESRYEIIVARLNAVPGKLLIVVDDLQHEPSGQVEQEIRRLLSRKDTYLLATSREKFEFNETLELGALTPDDCKYLFKAHCKKEYTDQQLNNLFQLASYNPLVIQLLASTLEFSAELTIEQLMENMDKNQMDTAGLQTTIKYDSNGREVYGKLYEQITNAFNLTTHNEQEWYLLTLLSILPPVNLPLPELLDIFFTKPDERPSIIEAVNSLTIKGLIIRETDEIRCHPLVLDVIRMQTTHYFIYSWIFTPLIHRLNQANSTFSNEGLRLKFYAEYIIERLKGEKADSILQPLLLLKNNLFLTYRYLGFMQEAAALIKDIEASLDDLKGIRLLDKRNIATILHNIGTHYADQNDFDKAEKYLLMAVKESVYEMFIQKVHYYNGLFLLCMRKGDFDGAIGYCQNAFDLLKGKEVKEFGHLMAMVYNNYGVYFLKAGDANASREHMLKAIDAHSKSESKEKPDALMPNYFANMAFTLSAMGQHEKAIEIVEMAVSMRLRFKLINDTGFLDLVRFAADICKAGGDQVKAVKYESIFTKFTGKPFPH